MKTMKSEYFGKVILFINVAPFLSPALTTPQAGTDTEVYPQEGRRHVSRKKTGMFL